MCGCSIERTDDIDVHVEETSSICSSISEANASEILENIEELFSHYL